MEQLQVSFESETIKSLCVTDDSGVIRFHCFESAFPLDTIKFYYDFMVRHYQNDLFHRIWEQTSTEVAINNPELTIKDVVKKLWQPAFEECLRILDALKKSTMKLQEIDDRFHRYSDPNDIKKHIENLFKGVGLCLDKPLPSECPIWIQNAVGQMQQYWTLARYSKAAKIVLKLRDRLNITGNFTVMEAIATKVKFCIFYYPLGYDLYTPLYTDVFSNKGEVSKVC